MNNQNKISWNQLVEACRSHLFDTTRIPIIPSCYVDDDEGTITFTYNSDMESYDVVLDFDTSVKQLTEENETVDFDTPFLPLNPNHSVTVYSDDVYKLNLRFYGIINPFN